MSSPGFGLSDVTDFLQRFASPNVYVAPDEANQQFDQLAQSGHPDFMQAVGSVLSQMDPNQFGQAAQNMAPNQRAGFAGSLLNTLQSMGVNLGPLGQMLGLSSLDPGQMGPQDIARLAGFAQQNAPGALHQVAQEQPFFLKALGNPLVQSALSMMAAKYLSNRG